MVLQDKELVEAGDVIFLLNRLGIKEEAASAWLVRTWPIAADPKGYPMTREVTVFPLDKVYIFLQMTPAE